MKRRKIILTDRQLEAVLTALSEWSQVEDTTETGKSIAKYLNKVRQSILKQWSKHETNPK